MVRSIVLAVACLFLRSRAGVPTFFQEIPRTRLEGRVFCWSGERVRELCCGSHAAPDVCGFDRHFITKHECCATDYSIMDPYQVTVATPLQFPSSDSSWDGEGTHPAHRDDQYAWEASMQHAVAERSVRLPFGFDTSLMEMLVYKGDMTELPPDVYGLTSWARAAGQHQPHRIIDVGGNYGAMTIVLARLFPQAKILVLEPNPLLCRFLIWNVRLHRLTNRIWPICAGLGNSEGTLAMRTCLEPWIGAPVNSCMSLGLSTFPRELADQEEVAAGRVVDVPIVSMSRLLAELGWGPSLSPVLPLSAEITHPSNVDVLKIDCEGCEWDTLLSAERKWTVRHVVGEIHFGCGMAACWPPPKDVDPNCTRATFYSGQELLEHVERCEHQHHLVRRAAAIPLNFKALATEYFRVWNTHDKNGIQKLHAPASVLKDWNGEHGPTNVDVAKGIAGIWESLPNIEIEVLAIFTSVTNTCVANIKVFVGDGRETVLNVVDVIEYDSAGLVTRIDAYKQI